jgi:hypothetical protein
MNQNIHTNHFERQKIYTNYQNNFIILKPPLSIYKNTVLFQERNKNTNYQNNFSVVKPILQISENTPLIKNRKKYINYDNIYRIHHNNFIRIYDNTPLIKERKRNINYENIYPNKKIKANMIRVSSYGSKLSNNFTYLMNNSQYNPIYSKEFFNQNTVITTDNFNKDEYNDDTLFWNKQILQNRKKAITFITNKYNSDKMFITNNRLVRSKSFIY